VTAAVWVGVAFAVVWTAEIVGRLI